MLELSKSERTQGNMRSSTSILLALIAILSIAAADCARYSQFFVGRNHLAKLTAGFARDVIDVPPLIMRLRSCRSFSETGLFWHGWYTIGTPFYRPLSLTVLWIEYHAFGTARYDLWMAVSIGLQLLLCFLLVLFVRGLSGSTNIALCSLIVYAGMRGLRLEAGAFNFLELAGLPPSMAAAMAWKDQPTQLCDVATMIALLCAQRERWLEGLTAAIVAILFKEAGWITFALVFIMLIGAGKLSIIPRWVYPATAVSIAIPLIARHYAGMPVIGGLQIGSNRNWGTRYFLSVSGVYLRSLTQFNWPATVFATAVYIVARQQKLSIVVRLGLSIALAAAASAIDSVQTDIPIAAGAAYLLDPAIQLPCIASSLLFVATAEIVYRDRATHRLLLLLFALSLIAALPYAAASQVSSHALELCYLFQSSIAGVAWAAAYRALKLKIALRRII